MSYQVLARKWRPQTFDDVLGQEHVVRTLKNAIEKNRVAHAFLFSGVRGVGKTSVARILAKALNCENAPTINPCNKCSSCEEITRGFSMDILEIDGASNTSVDDVRELRESIKYTPSRGKYRIYIIDEVHMLSTSAFNALLKTLEEPPAHVIFVFATTESHKIPMTVLSRCQRFDFKRIPTIDILKRLRHISKEEKIEIDENGLQLIAREAQGSMRDAQSILDQVISYAGNKLTAQDIKDVLGLFDYKLLFDITYALINKDSENCLKIIDDIHSYGYDLKQFSLNLLEHFRNLIVKRLAPDSKELLNLIDYEMEELSKQAQNADFKDIQQYFEILSSGIDEIARSNFPKLTLEMLILKMANIEPVYRLEEIISKLDEIKNSFMESQTSDIEIHAKDNELKKNETLASKIDSLENENHSSSTLTFNGKGLDENRINGASDKSVPHEGVDLWNRLKEFIKSKRPLLASFLEHGSLKWFDENTVEICFQENSIFFENLNDKDYLKSLKEILSDFFKRSININISKTKENLNLKNVETKGFEKDIKKRGETDLERKLIREAIEDPIIQKAIDIFKGTISEIKAIKRVEG